MQIVINICKDDFEEICMQSRMVEDTGSLFGRIRKAISHCVPLPKGHGKLKDVDHYIKMQWEHPDYSLTDDESTIIEADRSEEE